MTSERWQQVEQVLNEALELEPHRRAAFLARACAGDEELRHEVESLLAFTGRAGEFAEAPPDDIAAEVLAAAPEHSMVGRTLGHYELLLLLGAGGMGQVYRARDLRLDRDVAVKILSTQLAQDAEALRRFAREAKAVASLSHPNITAIYDFGTEDGVSYAVMELLEGQTLRERLSGAALPWREAVQIASAVAEGLAAAHAKGIIHRDLKPENIFLTAGGQVKVLDFGIARVKRVVLPDAETATTAANTTTPGTILGTVGYMSPEQVRGEEVEATSDIFSLGCVLFEMVSGQRPFARGNTMETLAAILREDAPALSKEKAPPKQVERVMRHCLEKQPAARYQSAPELLTDLRATLSTGRISLPVPGIPRPNRRLLRWAMAGAAVIVLALAALWYFAGRGAATIDSLAILPLVNASGEAEAEYLSDGIAESLINNLSQLANLRVMARGTAFTYKGKQVDPRQVGRDLGVRAVLTGHVTQRGDRFSVQMDLADARDGAQLWAERYDRTPADLAAMEAEIARRVSEKLRPRLTGAEKERLAKRYSEKGEAYQLYLKGRHFWNNWTGGEIRKGIEYFEQALQVDPGYALAWVGLADAYYGLSGVYRPSAEMMPKMRAAAQRALAIDDTLGEAHASLAFATGIYDWNWEGAEQEFKRAIELNPGYATAHFGYGLFLIATGRADEARRELKLTQDLDPLSPSFAVMVAWPYFRAVPSARRYDQAIIELRKVTEAYPDFATASSALGEVYALDGKFAEAIAAAQRARQLDSAPWSLVYLAWTYAAAGQKEQARAALAELQQIAQRQHISPTLLARIYATLGEREQAFAWLEKAYEKHDEELTLLNVYAPFDNLRSDPRFTDLLRRMNLAP